MKMPDIKLDEPTKKKIKELIIDTVSRYNKSSSAFTARRLADLPTDNLGIANRRFVTLNGALSSRPSSSVAAVGQRYFDTTNNRPIWYTAAGWRDATSSIVAQNN